MPRALLIRQRHGRRFAFGASFGVRPSVIFPDATPDTLKNPPPACRAAAAASSTAGAGFVLCDIVFTYLRCVLLYKMLLQ